MREYTFLSCHEQQQNNASYVIPGPPRSYQMTRRLAPILEKLKNTYSETFPTEAPMRIGLIVKPRNGASGYWSVAESADVGPIFVVELDDAIDGNECVFAHELAHPIIRLLGVPTGQSRGQPYPS